MTRVIHTGDTHVGYRQYNSPDRRQDFLAGFQSVVDDAVGEGAEADAVDAVIHAGDLFHDRRPDLQDLLGVLNGLVRLREADVPFLAVVGNHEATRGEQWLDLFEELGLAVRLGAHPFVVGDVAVYGLDFVPRSRRDELTYEFAPHDAEFAALVAHGQFAPLAPDVRGDAWDLTEVLSAATEPFDVALLGDEHTPDTQRLTVDGREVPATYCGSTERASAAERAGRGYNLVTFDDRGVDIRRRGIETREFVYVTVELADGEGVDRAREQVRQHDVTDAVVIVEVTGEGEPVTPASVEEAALADGALIARVTDRRDVDDEPTEERAVSFADPDEAVRERVTEMGLSTAARGLDEVVRETTVADSNVRDRTTDHVHELLEAGDLDAFAPAEGDSATGESPTEADANVDGAARGTDGTSDGAAGVAADSGSSGPAPAAARSAGDGAARAGEADASDTDASEDATGSGGDTGIDPTTDADEREAGVSVDAAVEGDPAGGEAPDRSQDQDSERDGQATLTDLAGGGSGGDDE
jgi:DNA repair exonuclease SbcCD nuclease subunit